MTEEPMSTGGVKGLLRNPYVIAFIVSAVVLALLRQPLRNIPPPPEPLGPMPEFVLQERGAGEVSLSSQSNQVWVAGAFSIGCTNGCRDVMGALGALETSYGINNSPIELLALCMDPEPDEEALTGYLGGFSPTGASWRVLTGAGAALSGVLEAFRPDEEQRSDGHYCRSRSLLLVDGDGQLRGAYASTELGVDETFHRSTAVDREMRKEWRAKSGKTP